MKKSIQADIAIFGGGIAGLWLLNRLRQQGYSAILFESNSIGGGQTHKSQGIIHGGMKYALQGSVTEAMKSIANMPSVWSACLRGEGEIDLQNVPILSSHQYLWTTRALTSKLAGFFASVALKGNVRSLPTEEFPTIFQHTDFKGQVYSLEEMVIDIHALLRELVKPYQDAIYKIDALQQKNLIFTKNNRLDACEIQAPGMEAVQIYAKKYIFTAGAGNEIVLNNLSNSQIGMQLRPLHMVIVKHEFPYSVYAHCLGLGATPRVTITTHACENGSVAWYLGGQLAEEGVKRSELEQIDFARKELKELFPWLDFSNAEFSTFRVDRAEAMQPGGKRPDSCYVNEIDNCIVAWPTKLAFAPLLAYEVLKKLDAQTIKTGKAELDALRAWPTPTIAKPMWD